MSWLIRKWYQKWIVVYMFYENESISSPYSCKARHTDSIFHVEYVIIVKDLMTDFRDDFNPVKHLRRTFFAKLDNGWNSDWVLNALKTYL